MSEKQTNIFKKFSEKEGRLKRFGIKKKGKIQVWREKKKECCK